MLRGFAIFCAVALCSALAGANDGWVVNVGDAYQYGKSNPFIQMASEDLRINLSGYGADVEVRYTFINHGPASRVYIGFPEYRGNVDVPALEGFRTWVDGQRVKVQRKSLSAVREMREYEVVWLKQVSFPRNGKRRIVVKYHTGLSGTASGDYGLYYILSTARTWRMPIRDFRVTVDWSKLTRVSRPDLILPGAVASWKVSGPCRRTSVVKNFVPRGELNLKMRFGFWNFTLNGKRMPLPTMPDDCVYGSGRNPMVPVQLLSRFLAGDFVTKGNKLYAASGRHKGLAVGIHKRAMIRGNEKLPCVYLREAIKALGGTTRYNAYDKRLDIRLKGNG